MTFLRTAVLGLFALMVMANPAQARRGRGGIVIINMGDDVMELRETASHAVTGDDGTEARLGKIGYHYSRFGLFWVDFWRWDGEYVLYSDGGSMLYVPLTDAELEEFGGAPFPWAYHLPPGFLGLLAALELWLVRRKPRSKRFALIAGGVLLAIALFLFWQGLGLGAMIPGFLGLYHLFAAKFSPAHASDDDDDDDDEVSDEAAPEPERPRPPARHSAPRVETDPFRAPPQAAPIIVDRPSAPAVAPIAEDPNAEAPKLLR